jgi:uncharacterized membrane protein YhdT
MHIKKKYIYIDITNNVRFCLMPYAALFRQNVIVLGLSSAGYNSVYYIHFLDIMMTFFRMNGTYVMSNTQKKSTRIKRWMEFSCLYLNILFSLTKKKWNLKNDFFFIYYSLETIHIVWLIQRQFCCWQIMELKKAQMIIYC